MGKNIVICSDGTWNRPEAKLGGDYPTNVLRLARAIRPRSANDAQTVFYDWGVGSDGDALTGGITGAGINKNIQDAYRFIVQNYAPGDKLFLFGFSRGAYTVRALCGMIYNAGIVKRPYANRIAEAFALYRDDGLDCKPSGSRSKTFRADFAQPGRRVHFVGVWDTVGSLGIPITFLGLFGKDHEFYDTKMGGNIVTARHALAIDERRSDFSPTIWIPRTGVDLQQVWFCGAHADVGGSYAPDTPTRALASDIPLKWLLGEARAAGLGIEPHLARGLTASDSATLHNSHAGLWRIKREAWRSLSPSDADGVPIPTAIHSSVRARYDANSGYRPDNLESLLGSNGGWPALIGE